MYTVKPVSKVIKANFMCPAHSAWIYVPFPKFMCLSYELFPYYHSWIFSDVILNTSFKNDILERNGISCFWLSETTLRPGVVVVYNRKLFHFRFLKFSMNKFWIWNLNNFKSLQDSRLELKPFSLIFQELSNDTKYMVVWATRTWLFSHRTKIYQTICPNSQVGYRTFIVLVGVLPIAEPKK